MAKSKQKQPKPKPPPPKADDFNAAQTLIRGQRTLAKGIGIIDESLDECQRRIRDSFVTAGEDGEKGEYPDKLVSHVAWITKYIAGPLSELRQQEKHNKAIVDAMSPEEVHRVVFEYVRSLDSEGRAVFRQLLDEREGQESLLG